MKKSQIYIKAAELIDSGHQYYSCLAINRVVDDNRGSIFNRQRYSASEQYSKMFGCEFDTFEILYYKKFQHRYRLSSNSEKVTDIVKDMRVLALCFAAAMAETKDL